MIKILRDEEQGYACLFDSTTMQVMGPVFYTGYEDPELFLNYIEAKWGKSPANWPRLDYVAHEWRTFEAELPEKLKAWGFTEITDDGEVMDMEWRSVSCYCKRVDLYDAKSAEDVLKTCTFWTCCGEEMDYTQFKNQEHCPSCGEGWC